MNMYKYQSTCIKTICISNKTVYTCKKTYVPVKILYEHVYNDNLLMTYQTQEVELYSNNKNLLKKILLLANIQSEHV